ncbi:fluoride efflux transporter FluC [Dietzia kunjamensis]|uniref:fluoride efflux transporter FluC n=1 Tax=Dietzia kunjamensis TaxID=322509 RepID=UPI0020978493|nr:CrcB family protein [Dietzia kunjamensis]USX46086.1 CrcB family protein [Dietzia kunjamensis]
MRFPAAVALVALGGAAGTYARVVVSLVVPDPALVATLAVNLVGAFALGYLATRLADGADRDGARPGRERRRGVRLLLGTGFCGGFTTYSLIALQAAMLMQRGDVPVAVLYGATTLALGAVATMLGIVLASRGRPDRARATS